jgi:hypothetical protein
VARELQKRTHEEAIAELETVGNTLTDILAAARRDGFTPQLSASRLARRASPQGLAARAKSGIHSPDGPVPVVDLQDRQRVRTVM